MNEFLSYLKNYLTEKFTNDTDIPLTVLMYDVYTVGHTPSSTKPEIQFQIMDNYENTSATSLAEGENARYIPVQFTAYVGEQRIGGTKKSAREASIIYGDKIKQFINEFKTNRTLNPNILVARNTTTSPALPMQGGEKIYTTAVRYEFVVTNPYAVGE